MNASTAPIARDGLPALGVVVAVVATIGFSVLAARALGMSRLFGRLTDGAVAIFGASAALALAAALPANPHKERATLFTVIGVSALSTLVMVLYPMLVQSGGLDARGRHLPRRHDPRRGAGRRRRLQPRHADRGHRDARLKDLANVGWKPIALMVFETVFLAASIWAMLRFGPMPG